MTERISLPALVDGRPTTATIVAGQHGDDWRLTVESPATLECEATGTDLFEALRQVRLHLEPRGIRLCCNGSRVDTWPSRLAREHGAGMVYVLSLWRPPTVRDLVFTLEAAEARRIGTVAEQEQFYARHLANRKRWFNFVNPLWWWIYLYTGSWGRPRAFKSAQAGGRWRQPGHRPQTRRVTRLRS